MALKDKIKIIRFRDLGDERGNLVVIEGDGIDIPFDIKRVFYIYGSDATVVRGKHANRQSEFLMVNVSGTSKVRVADGHEEMVVSLDEPGLGLYLPKMLWKDMYDFSKDSVLVVMSNMHYDGSEYIRDYDDKNKKSE
jgi:dTDP-4-dehydrorhamnose 3,5-epimerase-like enzyme